MESSVLGDGAMWAKEGEQHLSGSSGRSGWKGRTPQARNCGHSVLLKGPEVRSAGSGESTGDQHGLTLNRMLPGA